MTLRVAFQMDPLHSIDPTKDTTYVLALEAQARGFSLFYYRPENLFMEKGEVFAFAYPVKFLPDEDPFYHLGALKRIKLVDEVDVVLMRQDPPFDMNYITYCHMLEQVADKCRVINNPAEVRNCPEKLFPCQFAELMPPTLITRSERALRRFREEYEEIVLKPLFAHGGRDVFHLKAGDTNFNGIFELLVRSYGCPMVAQEFQPAIFETGDKRIIIIDGEPKGAIARLPAKGGVRSNLVAGGSANKVELDADDMRICDALKPELKRRGLMLTGIDVIGGKLTEVNVTSPTGIQAINRLNGVKLEADFWDAVMKC